MSDLIIFDQDILLFINMFHLKRLIKVRGMFEDEDEGNI